MEQFNDRQEEIYGLFKECDFFVSEVSVKGISYYNDLAEVKVSIYHDGGVCIEVLGEQYDGKFIYLGADVVEAITKQVDLFRVMYD